MSDLGIAVLGAGRIGALHAANLAREITDARLVSVMDKDRGRAEKAAVEGYATERLNVVLRDAGVHAVVIASPTDQHASQIIRAAQAGKAIFCEKPVSLSLPKAEEAMRVVQETGVPFQIGFQRRYDASFATARRRLDEGLIGRLEMFRAITCDPEPAPFSYLAGSGGIYADMAIHDIDMARYYCGEIEEVTAMGAALIVPELATVKDVDTSVLTMRFASGAVGVIQNWRRAVYGYEIRTELFGASGKLVVEEEQATAVRHYTSTGIHMDYHGWFLQRFRDAYRVELQAFVDAVRAGTTPTPGSHDALQSLRVALAARRSLHSRRTVRIQF